MSVATIRKMRKTLQMKPSSVKVVHEASKKNIQINRLIEQITMGNRKE